MALVPKIALCYTGGEYVLTESTGVYDADDNVGGFGDPNIEGSEVDSAVITITDHLGVEHEYTVTSQIPDTVTETFDFTNLTIELPDGITKVEYVITRGGDTYTACIEEAFFPKVRCCIHKLIKEFPNKNPYSGDDSVFIHSVLEVDAMLLGLITAAKSLSKTQISTILTTINQVCDYYDGQYGCGCS